MQSQGALVFKQFPNYFSIEQRQKGKQTLCSKLLEEIANTELSQENYELLHNRRESIVSKNELELFRNAIHAVYPKCTQVDA